MSKPSPILRALRRFAIPGAAFALAVVSLAYGVRNCAQDQRKRAYAERQAPLAKSLKKYRPLLARAAALQPNFKELSSEIAPSRCRELCDRIRARYELDPFQLKARCGDKTIESKLDICKDARIFADLGGAESQHGRKIGLMMQSQKRLNEQGKERLEVITLLLAEDHSLIEAHQLSFSGSSMNAKPTATTIRTFGPDGLLERIDRGERTELYATTPDGAVQLLRVNKGKAGDWVERVRGAGTTGWTKAHLLPTTGVWYTTTEGLRCFPPSYSELEIIRRDGSARCTWVRLRDGSSVQSWPRGDGCESGS